MGSGDGRDSPQTQVLGGEREVERLKGRCPDIRGGLRPAQCLGASPDYPGALEGGFSWLCIWNLSWGETGSTEGGGGG